jgi:hypothetical protein
MFGSGTLAVSLSGLVTRANLHGLKRCVLLRRASVTNANEGQQTSAFCELQDTAL